MRGLAFAVLSLSITLAGCTKHSSVENAAGVSTKDPHVQAEFARDSHRFGGRVKKSIDVIRYELKGRFDWQTDILSAQVAITLVRPMGLTTIELDSLVPRVKRVQLESGTLTDLAFRVDQAASALRIDIPESVTADTLRLLVSYELDGKPMAGRRANFKVVRPRTSDPAQSRVFYVRSEPQGAPAWMPCHDHPDDRALFDTEFTMAADERMIANGRLVKDTVDGGVRTMGYETEHTLPTYLMAFAQGEFVSATRQHGALPVSVWARRGVQVDWDSILDETVRQIAQFEKLLTPFPFEKYAIVLLPQFGGGMEHASITFNNETSSSQPLRGDYSLMAHELGHHWFGDYVTVRSWDDLWIKEGMATLLAAEAMSFYEDQNHTGVLMGETFRFSNGEAVRDKALEPEQKYGTGPYQRSAWYFTQLRSIVGEDVFWRTMRRALLEHAYGTISSEELLELFRPEMPADLFAKAVASLDAHEAPQVHVEHADGVVKLSLEDKENVLLAPLEIYARGAGGAESHRFLAPGTSIELKKEEGWLTVADPRDIHPPLTSWIRGEAAEAEQKAVRQGFYTLATPRNAAEIEVFKKMPATEQVNGLMAYMLWNADPAALMDVQRSLGTATGKYLVLAVACDQVSKASSEELVASWGGVLDDLFTTPPLLGIHWMTTPVVKESCRGRVPAAVESRLRLVQRDPATKLVSDAELAFLVRLPVDGAVRTWAPLAERGRSLRSRILATEAVLESGLNADGTPSAEAEEVKGFARRILRTSDIQEMVTSALAGTTIMKDKQALPELALVTRNESLEVSMNAFGACAAYIVSEGDAAMWDGFKRTIGPIETLRESVRDVLADPAERCKRFSL